MNYIDIEKFEQARYKIFSASRSRDGIGTLSEKSIHSVLKEYFAPNDQAKEVKINGMYADLFFDDEIFEIQTRSFDKIKKKLSVFLELYPVTVVFPIVRHRYITMMDKETGEVIHRRRSPKRGTIYDIFNELVRIKPYLHHEHLKFRLVLLDIQDYRSKSDKKSYRTRHDKIDVMPTGLVETLLIKNSDDLRAMLPEFTTPFTSKELSKSLKINLKTAQSMLNVLFYLDVVQRVGKSGNAFLYEMSDMAMPESR